MAEKKTINDYARELDAATPKWTADPTMTFTTSSANAVYQSARSPLSRRRSIGETGTVDTPGYWLHIVANGQGIPRTAEILEVADDLRSWWWLTSSDDVKTLERLPSSGTFIFLW